MGMARPARRSGRVRSPWILQDSAAAPLLSGSETSPMHTLRIFISSPGDGTARLWGLSNAEIDKNLLAAKAIRARIAPTVDAWFAGEPASVKAKLAEAKATMPPEDWREAANLVLMKRRLEAATSAPRAR